MMEETPFTIDGKLTQESIFLLGAICGAWQKFKKTHDLNSEAYKCCETTERFFNVLDAFECLSYGEKIDWRKLIKGTEQKSEY